MDIEPTLAFARRLAALRKPVWVRFVLVPGVTDDEATLTGIAEFAAGLGNVQRVEVLPFHQTGQLQVGAAWPRLHVEGRSAAVGRGRRKRVRSLPQGGPESLLTAGHAPLSGRRIPSLAIRVSSVLGFRPSSSDAPPGPRIRHAQLSRTPRM